jgi:hypothetical protein
MVFFRSGEGREAKEARGEEALIESRDTMQIITVIIHRDRKYDRKVAIYHTKTREVHRIISFKYDLR